MVLDDLLLIMTILLIRENNLPMRLRVVLGGLQIGITVTIWGGRAIGFSEAAI